MTAVAVMVLSVALWVCVGLAIVAPYGFLFVVGAVGCVLAIGAVMEAEIKRSSGVWR